MGGSFPKPEPNDAPRDWMDRCNLGYYVNPWLDNLAGWTEANPQFPSYPREGTFDPGYLASAHRMIFEGLGDPTWYNDYMCEGYRQWYGMKKVWDGYKYVYTPKKVLKSIPKPKPWKDGKPVDPEFVKPVMSVPPPYPGPEPSAPLVSAFASIQINEPEPGKPDPTKTKELVVRSPDTSSDSSSSESEADEPPNAACVWVRKPKGITIEPPSLTTLKDIISLIPPPTNPLPFIDMLIKTSRHCQLTGADYRFILQTKLGDSYDEEQLITAVKCLHPENDVPYTEYTKEEQFQLSDGDGNPDETPEGTPQSQQRKKKKKQRCGHVTKKVTVTFFWSQPEALDILRRDLTKYLLQIKQANRDLSQVTNCKQEKNETTTKFWTRFIEVWRHLGGLDLAQGQPNPLFLSTFLANCRSEVQLVLKYHLSDRNNLLVRDAGQKIRTIEADGLFEAKNKACLNVGTGNVGPQVNSGNRGGKQGQRKKGKCHYCGKEGHWIRECRKKQREEAGQGNPGQNQPQGFQPRSFNNQGPPIQHQPRPGPY